MQMSRAFEIIYILLNQKNTTAKELAERFGVSTRTIYRDVDTLSLAGIPVYTEKGKGGGIRLLPDFVLSKSMLNEEEQTEILGALEGLSRVKPAETSHALQKLSAVFNKPATNWLQVDFSDWGFSDDGLWAGLKSAILERRIVEFDYYSSWGEKTSRQIEPLQLWFKSRAWYIKGFCLTRQDLRTFKLTRVKHLTLTDKHFPQRDLSAVPPPDPGPPERRQPDIFLRLKIQEEMTYRVLDDFSEDMVEKQTDGSFIASILRPDGEWLYRFLLSFGEHIEVLEPLHVREIVREKAEKVAKKHL